jgi:hypothetical protein
MQMAFVSGYWMTDRADGGKFCSVIGKNDWGMV